MRNRRKLATKVGAGERMPAKVYPPIRPHAVRSGFIKPGQGYVFTRPSHAGYEASDASGHSAPIMLDIEGYSHPKRVSPGWAWRAENARNVK